MEAWLFFWYAIYLILLVFSFLQLEGNYINHAYWGNFTNPTIIYKWLIKGMYISYFIAQFPTFYFYEKILNKKKHFATILDLFLLLFIIVVPFESVLFQIFNIVWPIMGIYVMHILFSLLSWARKEFKAATSFLILGGYLMGVGMVFITPTLMQLGVILSILPPLLWISGTILAILPTRIPPDFFSRGFNYWYWYCGILIGLSLIVSLYMFIIIGTIEYGIVGGLFSIFYVVECYFVIKSVKNEEDHDKKKSLDVIGIFTKPDRIPEDEISVSIEKKICLVCKNKVKGFNFICNGCGAFYCENCAQTLSDIENMCWVCEAPFDESKPIKLAKEKKEEEIEIEPEENKPHKRKALAGSNSHPSADRTNLRN